MIEIYSQNEKKCQKYTKIITSYVFVHGTVFITSLTYAIYCFVTEKPFQMSYYLELFIDTDKPWGFGLLCFFQFTTTLTYALTVVSITAYFVCCCFYIGAICDHFKFLIHSIEKDVELFQSGNRILLSKTKMKYIRATQLHIKIFE